MLKSVGLYFEAQRDKTQIPLDHFKLNTLKFPGIYSEYAIIATPKIKLIDFLTYIWYNE